MYHCTLQVNPYESHNRANDVQYDLEKYLDNFSIPNSDVTIADISLFISDKWFCQKSLTISNFVTYLALPIVSVQS